MQACCKERADIFCFPSSHLHSAHVGYLEAFFFFFFFFVCGKERVGIFCFPSSHLPSSSLFAVSAGALSGAISASKGSRICTHFEDSRTGFLCSTLSEAAARVHCALCVLKHRYSSNVPCLPKISSVFLRSLFLGSNDFKEPGLHFVASIVL